MFRQAGQRFRCINMSTFVTELVTVFLKTHFSTWLESLTAEVQENDEFFRISAEKIHCCSCQ